MAEVAIEETSTATVTLRKSVSRVTRLLAPQRQDLDQPSPRAAARPRGGRRRRSASSPSARARCQVPDTTPPDRGRRAAALRARHLRQLLLVLGQPVEDLLRHGAQGRGQVRRPAPRPLRCAACAARRWRRPRLPGRARPPSQASGRITTRQHGQGGDAGGQLRRPPMRAASRSYRGETAPASTAAMNSAAANGRITRLSRYGGEDGEDERGPEARPRAAARGMLPPRPSSCRPRSMAGHYRPT